MVLPSWVGHCVGGLVGGAILGYMALPFLMSRGLLPRGLIDPGVGILAGPLLGGAIGAVVGLIAGKVAERRAAARRADLAESATRIGGQFSEHDAALQQQLQSDFPQKQLYMENVLRKDLVDLRLSVGDLSVTRSAGTRDDRSSRTVRQTAAYYRRDDVAFPGFSLQPAGLMHKLISAGTGFQGLRFPEQPEFERQYFALATDVNGTRALLDAGVLAWFATHPGLNVDVGGHGVVVYQDGKTVPPEALEGFIAEAAELFRLLERSARQAGLKPVAPLTTQDEVRAFAAQLPPSMAGSIEKEMRARLVTREDIDAFVRQKPPREIPSNIAHQYHGSRAIVLVGLVFAAIAGFMGPLFALKGQWGGAAFIALFFIGGVGLLFFGARSWWRQRSLLRRGELGAATIRSVEPAGWSDDEGEAFNVSASYQVAGARREGRGTVKGPAAGRVKSLAAERKMAPILYDPAHPERIVLVDALINAEKG